MFTRQGVEWKVERLSLMCKRWIEEGKDDWFQMSDSIQTHLEAYSWGRDSLGIRVSPVGCQFDPQVVHDGAR